MWNRTVAKGKKNREKIVHSTMVVPLNGIIPGKNTHNSEELAESGNQNQISFYLIKCF